MRDLLVVVPSRGRPASIARLRDAMDATCQGDTHLLGGVDEDDPALLAYLDVPGVWFQALRGVRGVVACMNQMVMPRLGDYRFVGVLGDDNVPRTEGWDVTVMEALGRTPFAFTNDLYPREPGTHPAHIFCRAEVVEALGYLGPPSMQHMFVDNAWLAWGKACGITYLHEVVIEHLHFTLDASRDDDTYRKAVSMWDTDKAAWETYQADGLAADIAKIRAAL